MAKITDIRVQTKNKDRCNLFVDGDFFTGLSIELVYKFSLKVGLEIDKEKLADIIEENERIEAFNKALTYLSKSLKTKRQVKDYLLKKGYGEKIVWQVIDKLKDYNVIDDKEYSKRYIESVSKNQGRRLTEYKLMMKGVRKEEIDSAYDNTEVDYAESALIVARRHFKNKEITNENLSKTYKYLIGRGFSYDDANYAISILKKENNSEECSEY